MYTNGFMLCKVSASGKNRNFSTTSVKNVIKANPKRYD